MQASREKEINEHINRVIWNILESGKSHLTDNEAISKRFTNEILTEPLDEPKKLKKNIIIFLLIFITDADTKTMKRLKRLVRTFTSNCKKPTFFWS